MALVRLVESGGGAGLSVARSIGSRAATAVGLRELSRSRRQRSPAGHDARARDMVVLSSYGDGSRGRHIRTWLLDGAPSFRNRSTRGRRDSRVPCPSMPEPPVVAAPSPGAASTDPSTSLIHARGLTKRFGDFTAVDGIDFDVAPGEAFGFLGPERRRQDLDDADDRLRVAGHRRRAGGPRHGPGRRRPADPRAARRRAPAGHARQRADRPREPAHLRPLLRPAARSARRRADELLEFVQLTERAKDLVEPLSGGMKRRLTIARALINEPDLLLLDEPTTGLDPQARHLLWDRLYRLKQRGVTLVLTTHYMDEAEQLCDRLVVMDKAKIVAEGSPAQLIEQLLDAGGRRAPLRAGHPGDARRPARRARPSGSSACPTGSCSTPTTARRPSSRPTSAASSPRRCSSAGRRSRTSSCA